MKSLKQAPCPITIDLNVCSIFAVYILHLLCSPAPLLLCCSVGLACVTRSGGASRTGLSRVPAGTDKRSTSVAGTSTVRYSADGGGGCGHRCRRCHLAEFGQARRRRSLPGGRGHVCRSTRTTKLATSSRSAVLRCICRSSSSAAQPSCSRHGPDRREWAADY